METVELSVCKLVLKSSGLYVLASKRSLLLVCWTSVLEISKIGRNHQIVCTGYHGDKDDINVSVQIIS